MGKHDGMIMGAVLVTIYSVSHIEMFHRQAEGFGNCHVLKAFDCSGKLMRGSRGREKVFVENALIFIFLERLVCHLSFFWNNFIGVAVTSVFLSLRYSLIYLLVALLIVVSL